MKTSRRIWPARSTRGALESRRRRAAAFIGRDGKPWGRFVAHLAALSMPGTARVSGPLAQRAAQAARDPRNAHVWAPGPPPATNPAMGRRRASSLLVRPGSALALASFASLAGAGSPAPLAWTRRLFLRTRARSRAWACSLAPDTARAGTLGLATRAGARGLAPGTAGARGAGRGSRSRRWTGRAGAGSVGTCAGRRDSPGRSGARRLLHSNPRRSLHPRPRRLLHGCRCRRPLHCPRRPLRPRRGCRRRLPRPWRHLRRRRRPHRLRLGLGRQRRFHRPRWRCRGPRSPGRWSRRRGSVTAALGAGRGPSAPTGAAGGPARGRPRGRTRRGLPHGRSTRGLAGGRGLPGGVSYPPAVCRTGRGCPARARRRNRRTARPGRCRRGRTSARGAFTGNSPGCLTARAGGDGGCRAGRPGGTACAAR